QDMKSGVAAMIAAAGEVAARGLPSGRVIVACVVDEEHSSIGADALVTAWAADAAVVTGPTDLALAVGHKGLAGLELEGFGRGARGVGRSGAGQPSGGRPGCDPAARTRAEPPRVARSRTPAASAARAGWDGVAARVNRGRGARMEQLPGSRDAPDGTPHASERADRRSAARTERDHGRADRGRSNVSGERQGIVQPGRV